MTMPSPSSLPRVPALVVGGGPAGLVAAILLARAGVGTVLLAPEARADARTSALMTGALALLERCGVWPALRDAAAPLRRMQMLDATRRLWRARDIRFDARELGLDAFGWNIPNTALTAALHDVAAHTPGLTVVAEAASAVAPGEDHVRVDTASGRSWTARLVVAADGRNSLARAAAGIDVASWDYDQMALVLNLRHARPHRDTSTEFHTGSGPFTLVPLPGPDHRSSLVAVLRPEDARRLHGLDDAALGAELTARAHNLLGALTPEGPRGLFPLGGATARRFADRRVALVGEAAHVLPPIGAQGLNLGLRDAGVIAALAGEAARSAADPGSPQVMSAYDRARRTDVRTRTTAVDALNRSLLAGFLPADMVRAAGIALLSDIPPLKRAVMRLGLGARS